MFEKFLRTRSGGVVGATSWIRSSPTSRVSANSSAASSPGRSGTISPANPAALASSRNCFCACEDDRARDHRHQRRRLSFEGCHAIEDRPRCDLLPERPRVRRLNHRSVGDRVAVREPDFDQVRTFPWLRIGQQLPASRGHIRIAGGDERHERQPTGGLESSEGVRNWSGHSTISILRMPPMLLDFAGFLAD